MEWINLILGLLIGSGATTYYFKKKLKTHEHNLALRKELIDSFRSYGNAYFATISTSRGNRQKVGQSIFEVQQQEEVVKNNMLSTAINISQMSNRKLRNTISIFLDEPTRENYDSILSNLSYIK